MSSKRYPEEFKIEAVKQVSERDHPLAEVASRIGVSQHSLPAKALQEQQSQSVEIQRLKAELKRVTEERDILKWPQRPPRGTGAIHTSETP